jgi:uncharacterized protein (TIGR02757 family)
MDALVATFGPEHLSPDPLEVVRRFRDPRDVEVVGFLAAALAFGSARGALRSAEELVGRLTEGEGANVAVGGGAGAASPADAVRAWDAVRDLPRLQGWRHRWLGAHDASAILHVLGRALRDHGSLETFFAAGDTDAADIAPAIASFCARALALAPRPVPPRLAFWLSGPGGGGTAKRLCLWLRWMCRRDQLDPGPWTRIDPARLVIPLDVHVARIARYVGLLRRRTSDWRAAVEVTSNLRRFDAADPVRFDYALCRLGVLGTCPKRRQARKCDACPLYEVCLL